MVDSAGRLCVGVVGLGVIGGSIGKSLPAAGYRVIGFDINPTIAARALDLRAVGAVASSLEELARAVDLVVIATPPGVTVATAEAAFAAGARAVTDVASVKGPIVDLLGSRANFVGSHPIAGSEKSGPDAARSDLFVGATWVLTPTSATSSKTLDLVRQFVIDVGARVIVIDAARHDRHAAIVSHLPHVIAALITGVLAHDAEAGELARMVGPGWQGTTRVASGSPDLWTDIVRGNATAILAALDAFTDELASFRRELLDGDMGSVHRTLACAAEARDGVLQASAQTVDTFGAPIGGNVDHSLDGRVRRLPPCTCDLRAAS